MSGGFGNDTYYVDVTGDIVNEAANAGYDTVYAHATYTLSSDVDALYLTGTGNFDATGNALDNVIGGNAGNNTIDGGAGADTMTGGAGNDIYIVDNASDVVIENAGEGTDSVHASVSFSLDGGFVESLLLTGTGDINATGNSLDNTLTGNSGNNVIDGGAGADIMSGGLGNDTYYVDNVNDIVNEASGQGTDTIFASVSYSLAVAGRVVEVLTLTGTGQYQRYR